jgi:hypothetical protein
VFNVEHDDNGLWLNSNNGHPDNFWNGNNRWVFVRPATGFVSPPYLGEFCFVIWPFQPPNILPISSSGADKAAYFLLSKVLVSQSTIKSIFKASSF